MLIFSNERVTGLLLTYQSLDNYESEEAVVLMGHILEETQTLVHALTKGYAVEYPHADMVQEVLIHIMNVIPQFDPTLGATLHGWLSTVIRNKATSILRTEARTPWSVTDSLTEEITEQDTVQTYQGEDRSVTFIRWLGNYLIDRYPSLEEHDLRRMAEIIVHNLIDGLAKKTTIQMLRDSFQHCPTVNRTRLVNIYHSSLWFLRAVEDVTGRQDVPGEAALEWTLIPELEMSLGKDLSNWVFTLFQGLTVHFRQT